ncbi:MAG TPA: hypothetical protein VKT26_07920, partial [Acetobacteraceae bacterium]|nr:hypothetical protein [Acetobacteraceae bacterium]
VRTKADADDRVSAGFQRRGQNQQGRWDQITQRQPLWRWSGVGTVNCDAGPPRHRIGELERFAIDEI